ncbi:hypothetical protein [Bradyrhizobium sp. AZCC 1699]|uniref:hypothetical protein n=1 Tax=Bradyrhizobium sp. AZCC 1699 TaxID=3117024 RepID=UPI002FF123AE
MNRITFPLKRKMRGPEVGNLQDARQLLLDRGVLLANDEAARRELAAALRGERAEQTYGSATTKLVERFQEERSLPLTGEVDEQIGGGALNAVLGDLGGVFSAAADHLVDGSVASRISAINGWPARPRHGQILRARCRARRGQDRRARQLPGLILRLRAQAARQGQAGPAGARLLRQTLPCQLRGPLQRLATVAHVLHSRASFEQIVEALSSQGTPHVSNVATDGLAKDLEKRYMLLDIGALE